MSSTDPSASVARSTAAAATAWVFDVSEGLALMAMSFISAEVSHDLTGSRPDQARSRSGIAERRWPTRSAGVEGGANRPDERGRTGRALAVEQAAHQRRADDDAVGLGADLDGLGRDDTPTPTSTGLSVTALSRRAITSELAARTSRSPVTPSSPTA